MMCEEYRVMTLRLWRTQGSAMNETIKNRPTLI